MDKEFIALTTAFAAGMEWHKITELLEKDSDEFNGAIPKDGSSFGFWCRTLIRQLFAQHEAHLFHLGRMLLLSHDANLISLAEDDVMILRGESFRLKRDGKVERQKNKIRGTDYVLFIVRVGSELFPEMKPIDKASNEWFEFREAVKIRDRITHPQFAKDLEVIQEEALIVQRALCWLPVILGKIPEELSKVCAAAAAARDQSPVN